MHSYVFTFLVCLTLWTHQSFVWSLTTLKPGSQDLDCREDNCVDFSNALHLKRIDITIPHDDPYGYGDEHPGTSSHGPHDDPNPQGYSGPIGNPLSTSDDPNKILPYTDYQQRGIIAASRLDQVISSRLPDVGQKPHPGYSEEILHQNLKDLLPVCHDPDIGLDPTHDYIRMRLKSKAGPEGIPPAGEDTVYDAAYNIADGAIVVRNMAKAEDLWPKGDPNNVRISDLMAQVWTQLGGDLRNLRFVIQDSILNPGTIATMEDVYREVNFPDSYIGEFRRPAAGDNSAMAQAYNALLGTDNVRPTVYMLTDWHTEAGDMLVQKILLFPPGVNDGMIWHLAMVLGT